MLLATLHIISANNQPDDIIYIRSSSELHRNRLMVTFRPGDSGCAKTSFFMPGYRVLDYVDDILQSLRRDADPFEEVQITTRIHPAVLFHVSQLDDRDTRHLILGMLETAFDARWSIIV